MELVMLNHTATKAANYCTTKCGVAVGTLQPLYMIDDMSSNSVETRLEAYYHSDSTAVAQPCPLQTAVAQGAPIKAVWKNL